MAEQIFENDVSFCVNNFLAGLTTEETNMLKRTDNPSREMINKILVEFKHTNGDFINEMSEIEARISKNVNFPTIFLAEMFNEATLQIPSRWGDKNEVSRTILGLVAETEASNLRKDQILFRDARDMQSPHALERAQTINRLTSFRSNLMQPKTPPLNERPGTMQI